MSSTRRTLTQLCRQCTRTQSLHINPPQIRCFSLHTPLSSGHSKWATIKHDKAKVDAARGRTRTMFAAEIAHASRLYGADPKMNTRLADAIARARKASMPKANIETAIARGQGLSVSGSKLEPFLEEASYPPGIAILVDVLTDNKQQAKIDIRKIFKFHGANLSNTAYLFEKRGQLVFGAKEGVDEESMLEEAVNVNALDVEMSESGWTVYTEIQDMTVVTEHLKNKLGLEIEESEIIWDAKDLIEVDDKAAVPLLDMIEKLKEIPSVKEIYTNAK